jgi:hypothetical protein
MSNEQGHPYRTIDPLHARVQAVEDRLENVYANIDRHDADLEIVGERAGDALAAAHKKEPAKSVLVGALRELGKIIMILGIVGCIALPITLSFQSCAESREDDRQRAIDACQVVGMEFLEQTKHYTICVGDREIVRISRVTYNSTEVVNLTERNEN